jgi:hypothetical protein
MYKERCAVSGFYAIGIVTDKQLPPSLREERYYAIGIIIEMNKPNKTPPHYMRTSNN